MTLKRDRKRKEKTKPKKKMLEVIVTDSEEFAELPASRKTNGAVWDMKASPLFLTSTPRALFSLLLVLWTLSAKLM